MGCFIAIQIPDDLRRDITAFCSQRDYPLTHPHIKLVSPVLLENIPVVEQKLESFCLAQPEFKATLSAPMANGNQILYLAVQGESMREVRTRLSNHLGVRPLANFRPHLTIMRQGKGSALDIPLYLKEAKQYFSTPYTFTVSGATLFTNTFREPEFKPEITIPFSGR